MIGNEIHELAKILWPINRSITGDGVRATLSIIQEHLPDLEIHEVPTGTRVFDWTVPQEWRINDAWLIGPDGKRFCNFRDNNLHVMGYSVPVRAKMRLHELQQHLYSIPEKPDAIPFVTSYYKKRWGFCISQQERDRLPEGEYEVLIDSELFDGNLTYGELLIKGRTAKEVFLSTYVCHPSMANNELSGPTVTTFIAKWLTELRSTRYSYRIVFIPETIGSITYLSIHKDRMIANIIAGFIVNCIGDDRAYSYLPSRRGDTLSDIVAKHVLKHIDPSFKSYKWTFRGSDERQYCAPHVDLPIASIMRSKYDEYDEYHTSLDDLVNVVTPQGLEGGFNAFKKAIEVIEGNYYPTVNCFCEPQLGKRGLYPAASTKDTFAEVQLMMDLITWSDGTKSLLEIAEICEVPVWAIYPIVEKLVAHELLALSDVPSHSPGAHPVRGVP